VPLALKIAPDVDADQIRDIGAALLRHKHRRRDRHQHHAEPPRRRRHAPCEPAGGLSGAPVFDLSNIVIRALKKEVGDAVPIIGVGGILSGRDAKAKIAAGAQLVQLYSGLIYRGPALVRECAEALAEEIRQAAAGDQGRRSEREPDLDPRRPPQPGREEHPSRSLKRLQPS
jgi:dihydroorotate dehydrogenase